MSDEYAIVYDGDPRMDGSHERRQIGHFKTLDEARAGFALVVARSDRAPKPRLRIERRKIGPWILVEGSEL